MEYEQLSVFGWEDTTKNNNLIKERKRNGLTQKDVATEVGITIRYYQYIEAGKRKPTVFIVLKLAETLHTTVDKIFTP